MKDFLKKIKVYSLKNNRKKILKNYYSKEMRKGKTFRANFLDKFLMSLISFVLILFFLMYKSQKILLPIYISLLFMFFLSRIFSSISKKVENKKIEDINEDLKQKKILKQFENFSREDFINSIKDLLGEYLQVEIEDGSSPIDLKYKIDGKICGIKCQQSTLEYTISSREVGVFIRESKEKGIEKFIFVTNSYFIDKERYKDKIILYDFDDLTQFLKDTDKYPSDLDMENYIVDRFMDRRSNVKKEMKKMNIKKIIQLYIIAFVFYLTANFVAYALYYKIISIICFLLATAMGGYNISEHVYVKSK